jgi:hypothetical protein
MHEPHFLICDCREIELRASAIVEIERDGLIALRLRNLHGVRSDEIGEW